VRKIMDSSVMPHPPGIQLALFPEPSAAPPVVDQLGLPPNAAVLAMQLQSMLGLLGVHVAVALPPPFCVIPHWLPQKYQPAVAVAARALRDHMLQAGTTVGGEPALEAALSQLAVIPGLAGLVLAPELVVQQSLAAASHTIQRKLSTTVGAISIGHEEQRLCAVVARCLAMLLVAHDAASHPVAEQTLALRQLCESLKPLGKAAEVDCQELRHSLQSLAEAQQILALQQQARPGN